MLIFSWTTRKSYGGRFISFLYGWSLFFVIQTGAIAAVGTAFASYAGHFLGQVMPYGPWTLRTVAVASILYLTLMNCIGVRVGGQIQNLFTFLKVAGLGGLIGVGLLFGQGDITHFTPFLPAEKGTADMIGGFGTAMILALFTYSGWGFSTFVAGETKNPRRNIPLSIILGIAIVLVIYMLTNFVYFYILPFDQLQASTLPAADTMEVLIGPMGAALISLVIMLSTFGTLNVQLLSPSRVYFAMSRHHLFFSWFDNVHPRFKTPFFAILLQGIWASGLALSGTYRQIITYTVFPGTLFDVLAIAGVIILRRRAPDLQRSYRVWGYPITPLLFLVVMSGYLLNALIYRFQECMVGIILALSGLPFYFYWSRKRGEADRSNALNAE